MGSMDRNATMSLARIKEGCCSRGTFGRVSELGFPFPDVQGSGGIFNAEGGVIEFDTEETISFFNNIFGVDVSC